VDRRPLRRRGGARGDHRRQVPAAGETESAYHAAAATEGENAQAVAKYLKERYIDRGKLGVGTGEGFYTYPAATQTRP
jgi:3-hydroxyacyl-CoA dehydrogenase